MKIRVSHRKILSTNSPYIKIEATRTNWDVEEHKIAYVAFEYESELTLLTGMLEAALNELLYKLENMDID